MLQVRLRPATEHGYNQLNAYTASAQNEDTPPYKTENHTYDGRCVQISKTIFK